MCSEVAKKIQVAPDHRVPGKGRGTSLERCNFGDYKALLWDTRVAPSKAGEVLQIPTGQLLEARTEVMAHIK